MAILAAQPAGMTLTEMAADAGLTRAGARRFLLTLVATGYAAQDGRRFALTPRLLGACPAMARRHVAVVVRRAASCARWRRS